MPDTATRRDKARSPLDHDPQRLRQRRVAAGLTQAKLAAAAEISASHLSEIEGGTRNPSPAVLVRLAEALHCQPTDLMPPAGGS
ncbi:helix-turn-helix transcriptional regulator [Dactylosporangium salmoneum]|uniref:HTH cro/C1-type domain-containing protein n=1 Tax=Dactylosporangium salmoneum TaxID=53361 RepID=A0ABN3FDG6_9ACTN